MDTTGGNRRPAFLLALAVLLAVAAPWSGHRLPEPSSSVAKAATHQDQGANRHRATGEAPKPGQRPVVPHLDATLSDHSGLIRPRATGTTAALESVLFGHPRTAPPTQRGPPRA